MTRTRQTAHLAGAAILAALGVSGCEGGRTRGRPAVVATVHGEEITALDLARDLRRLKRENEGVAPRNEEELDRVRRTLLDRQIDRRALLAEARRRQIAVSDEEVQRALAAKRQGYPGATFDEEVAQSELTRAELAERVREQLAIHKLMRTETAAAGPVSPEAARAWYDAHSAEFDLPERVRARQIVTKTEEHAQQILEALRKGGDFEELARKHSLSPDGKQGGHLGFFPRGVMPPAFDEVCFALSPGQTSGVVASSYGYHLFQVVERKPAERRAFEDARAEIEGRIVRERAGEAERALLARLRAEANIRVDEEALRRVR